MTSPPSIPAIPTKYRGIQFRSRLEARWAAMFDNLGWRYEYEPMDLGGWIPDFILYGKGAEVLVEVKPWNPETEPDPDLIRKIEQSGADQNVLLVGSTLQYWDRFEMFGPAPLIGWLGECFPRLELEEGIKLATFWFLPCPITQWDGYWNRNEVRREGYGFSHTAGGYHDRMTGANYKEFGGADWPEIEAMWIDAGNQVQWKAPQKTALPPINSSPERLAQFICAAAIALGPLYAREDREGDELSIMADEAATFAERLAYEFEARMQKP